MAKLKGKIAQWRHTSDSLQIGNKMTGHTSYQWINLHITMLRIPVLATCLLNSTTTTIHEFFLKIILILAPDLTLPMNWQRS